MHSRERVLTALAHQQPDRCPVDFWTEYGVRDRLLQHFGVASEQDLYDRLEIDLQFVFPESTLPPPEILPDGTWYDDMGLHRCEVVTEIVTYSEYASAPFAEAEDVGDLEGYDKWPDPDSFDWKHFSDRIGNLHEKRCIKLHAGGIFEAAWPMRGLSQFLMDMIAAPEMAHFILEKRLDYWCRFIKNALDAAGDKIDFVYTYDDIAMQQGLLMSPKHLEEFVYPYHRRMNECIKRYGKRIIFHSCGSIISEIDNLRQLPIDVLNPIQPLAKDMDFQTIKDRFGKTLCFHGGIDIQQLLPNGTPEDVRRGVKRAISILGRDGGYIMTSAHYLQNDTPTENVLAMYDPSLR